MSKVKQKKRVGIAIPKALHDKLAKRKERTRIPIQAQVIEAINKQMESEA